MNVLIVVTAEDQATVGLMSTNQPSAGVEGSMLSDARSQLAMQDVIVRYMAMDKTGRLETFIDACTQVEPE